MSINPGLKDTLSAIPPDASTESKQDDIIAKQPTSLGDGDNVDLQDNDRTVGETKGTMIIAKDSNDKARPIEVSGIDNNALKVFEQNTHLLKEVVKLLIINNKYLSEIVGDTIKDSK